VLTADAGPIPGNGQWVVVVSEDGVPRKTIPLGTYAFPQVSVRTKLAEAGYRLDPAQERDPNRWAGWGATEYGFSARLEPLEE
jgi:hypothetical protein